MKTSLAATKTNLLKVKKSLELTREGFELLDEKRKILLQELSAVIDSVDKNQEKVNAALHRAYQAVDRAQVAVGTRRMEELGFSVDMTSEIFITQRRVMGVSVPVISARIRENPPYYSLYDVNLNVDEVIVQFKQVLQALAVLAEKKITLLRLAEEARKTIRKVNALEKIYIPYYSEAQKSISERLDEESRDAFGMLKLIKRKKMQKA